MFDKLHALAAKLHLSPKVFDPIAAAVVLAIVDLIAYGDLNLTGVRLAVAGAVLLATGVSAPPALGLTQAQVEAHARKQSHRPGVHR